jgi:hypothetical protein
MDILHAHGLAELALISGVFVLAGMVKGVDSRRSPWACWG